jgi:hypothetical protein
VDVKRGIEVVLPLRMAKKVKEVKEQVISLGKGFRQFENLLQVR